MIRTRKPILLLMFFVSAAFAALAQTPDSAHTVGLDYNLPKEYTIAGIEITGAVFNDTAIIRMLSGLRVGDAIEIPSEKLSRSISNLWKQGLFADIQVYASKIEGNNAWIKLAVVELPRFTKPLFIGFEKKEVEKLTDKILPYKGKPVDENLLVTLKFLAEDFIKEKGYFDANVATQIKADTGNLASVVLTLYKGISYKINSIHIAGNAAITNKEVKRQMKDTKEKAWYRIFKKSKFYKENYEADKNRVLQLYQSKGYNNAEIKSDTVYPFSPKLLNVDMVIEEGKLYYYRSISWVGNKLYSTDTLNKVLAIKRGDIYNMTLLDQALHMGPGGVDIAALYMDRGYLFFNVMPVVTGMQGDSVDVELRVYEGKPAIINNVIIKGNTRTNDYVIRREIYTKPGQLFRRTDLIMSREALMRLGYFDPAQMQVNPLPNATNGTVDIEYILTEKPTDQITFSGGIGGGQVVGTLGLVFNNFSFKNFFKREAWRPVPSGDGKILSIQAQTNGPNFQSYNVSFTEPWLGDKKPNSLTNSVFYNIRRSGGEYFEAMGVSTTIGTQWKKPDNYFGALYSLNLLRYKNSANSYTGAAYNVNVGLRIYRNSTNEASDYPTFGSRVSLSVQATPPWSAGNNLKLKDKLLEYHKWKFDLAWYQELAPKLVLNATAHFGYLGFYNRNIGTIPYERFYMGGIQIGNTNFIGQDFVNLRGYGPGALSPTNGSALYNRFVLELRYPILQNKGSGISMFGLVFAEGGNAWDRISDYNPVNLKRSAGAGIRVTLPMFGTMGFDAGYGFDRIERNGSGQKWEFHFVIGKDIN